MNRGPLNITGKTTCEQELIVDLDASLNSNLFVQQDANINGYLTAERVYQDISSPYWLLPPGVITPYGGASAPDGYLLCNGSAVSRTTYSELFNVIGTSYGDTENITTFQLPNLIDRVPKYTTSSPGTQGGADTQAISISNMPAHDHGGVTGTDGNHTHTFTGLSGAIGSGTVGNPDSTGSSEPDIQSVTTVTTSEEPVHSHTISSQGAGSSFSVVNSYVTVRYIIKF